MTMTQERVKSLTEFLSADLERAKELVVLEPGEALPKINAFGYDFTIDEINEYSVALKETANNQGELDLDALDDVAGGVVGAIITGAAILVAAVITSRAW